MVCHLLKHVDCLVQLSVDVAISKCHDFKVGMKWNPYWNYSSKIKSSCKRSLKGLKFRWKKLVLSNRIYMAQWF